VLLDIRPCDYDYILPIAAIMAGKLGWLCGRLCQAEPEMLRSPKLNILSVSSNIGTMTTAQRLTVSPSILMARTALLSTLFLAFAAGAAEPAAAAPSPSTVEEKYRDGAEFNNNLVTDLSP
jgi:hypothetical protein